MRGSAPKTPHIESNGRQTIWHSRPNQLLKYRSLQGKPRPCQHHAHIHKWIGQWTGMVWACSCLPCLATLQSMWNCYVHLEGLGKSPENIKHEMCVVGGPARGRDWFGGTSETPWGTYRTTIKAAAICQTWSKVRSNIALTGLWWPQHIMRSENLEDSGPLSAASTNSTSSTRLLEGFSGCTSYLHTKKLTW